MSVKEMTIAELANACTSEMENYRMGAPHDDQYWLELFHRAIVERNATAWQMIQERLRPNVMRWMRHHHKRSSACLLESEENYVAMAFARFWQAAVHNRRLQFTSFAAVLHYLYASLNGAILDTLRAYAHPHEVALPELDFAGEPLVEEDDNDTELLEVILKFLPNPREQRLAYLLFHCGLKPREIVLHCPGEFDTVKDIYRLRRNIIERLQRQIEPIRWQLAH
ncbi:MAG: sigma-70 family RNA polymerase sigma factor [Ktedonobacteraceae bacterium]|nr:sigma-70 family RNA polymerase sigma factor [Ktedonobacteraceae bacterium]